MGREPLRRPPQNGFAQPGNVHEAMRDRGERNAPIAQSKWLPLYFLPGKEPQKKHSQPGVLSHLEKILILQSSHLTNRIRSIADTDESNPRLTKPLHPSNSGFTSPRLHDTSVEVHRHGSANALAGATARLHPDNGRPHCFRKFQGFQEQDRMLRHGSNVGS